MPESRTSRAADGHHAAAVVSRDVERFVVPAAKEHGVGFVSYSTLASGFHADFVS